MAGKYRGSGLFEWLIENVPFADPLAKIGVITIGSTLLILGNGSGWVVYSLKTLVDTITELTEFAKEVWHTDW